MTGKLTKSRAKYIKSLQQKKYRDEYGQFIVEGIKLVEEALNAPDRVDFIVYTGDIQDYGFPFPENAFSASPKELGMISSLKSANKVLAVCHKHEPSGKMDYKKPMLLLEDISDPGNFGTIIRLSDWFGISQIISSPDSVDLYNPKVVQATMGGIFRVNCFAQNLEEILGNAPAERTIYRADMEGENLYEIAIQTPFILVMGSESHGVSDQLRKLIPNAVSIPRFGGGESLNVAVSTGIILSEFKRKL